MSILVQFAIDDVKTALINATPTNREHIFDVCIAYTLHQDSAKAAVWRSIATLIQHMCNENDLEIGEK